MLRKNLHKPGGPIGQNRPLSACWQLVQRLLILSIACICLSVSLPSNACSAQRIAVLYPEVSSPYKAIFESIIEGIKSRNAAEYILYPLREDPNLEPLRKKLVARKVNGIIALGKRGFLTAQQLNMSLPTSIGALPLIPNGISGISLAAAPEQVFARLKSLVPDSRQVFVVYSPKANSWLLPYAEKAVRELDLKLVALAAEDLRETMHLYRQILENNRGRGTSIWLLLDKLTADEDIVLPMLLQEAWNREVVIVSSKPTHVQRGALFSLYPDNFGMGQELAEQIQLQLRQGETGVIPLKKLQLAVNLRTAAHLGLTFSTSQLQTFDLSFPSR